MPFDGLPDGYRIAISALAAGILPPEQREAMFQVYAFCRAVDYVADDVSTRTRDHWRFGDRLT